MPGGDRTGPAGFGPMTGRAAGYCAGYSVPGFANPAPGRGFRGQGRGGGWGRRNWYYATGRPGWERAAYGQPAYGASYPYPVNSPTPSPQEERQFLEEQSRELQKQLEDIKQRLDNIAVEQTESK